MKTRLPLAAAVLSALALAGCDGKTERIVTPPATPPAWLDLSHLDPSLADRCDLTLAEYCLFPFPNNHFTRPDPDSQTGLRVDLHPDSMPVSAAGKAIDPSEWNRNDGFSPGSVLLARVPDLDLAATGAVRITDIARSRDADAPILLIDADSGERQLIWAELDAQAGSDAERSLMVRVARNLIEGRRYIAVLRNLKNAAGEPLDPEPLFRAYRENVDTGIAEFEARRPAMEALFADLARHGIDRDDIYLAWDFTVASQANLTGRLLHIRDQAFSLLGGGAPSFTATIDDPPAAPAFSRTISGSFEVPNFLDSADGGPGSRFHYDSDAADALPAQLTPGATLTARYRCQISPSTVSDFGDPNAVTTPARAALYGHGLFGEGPGGEFRGGAVQAMQSEHNVMFCATDWIGMSNADAASIVPLLLQDLSLMPAMPDRTQQGFVNAMFLAELINHPDGFASHPAFRGPDGELVFVPGDVAYDGNSQGGILGGALVATAPNIHRGVLGVPGANYSLLLQRYAPFASRFGAAYYPSYPDARDQQLGFALMQMLWDRGENNGYLSHLAGRHLPGTSPDKAVLLHVALGDHQVTQWSAEILARSIGAAIHEPTVSLGEHPDDNPYVDIPLISYPHDGHAIMVWDSGDYDPALGKGTPLPPTDNIGPTVGDDPHESPRNTVAARRQKAAFMWQGGQVIDVCGNDICKSFDYTRPRQ